MPIPLRRRTFLAASALLAGAQAGAQADPKFPPVVKLVVPFPPGGSNDVVARALAPLLSKRLNTSVIVDNRAGAAGVIGSDYVAKAPRDGSVLLLSSSSFLTSAATQPKLPYDPLAAFAPVALMANGPMLLAVPASAPYKTQADLLAAARSRPGALNYGSSGIGSLGHLATELLNAQAGVQTAHVPYKGASEALLGLVSGQIQLMVSNYSSLASQIKAGKLTALAVTSPARSNAFPELPPISDAVPGYGVEIWVGLLAPAGTPAPLVARLNREMNALADAPELRAVLDPDGAAPMRLDPAAFGTRMKEELAQWKRIAAERHISTE
ncbi:tripartite tricarboxylate transporter substrate binding protein [Ramlibacter sp. G-1-2-2]|uniref:Tripartite tricarboxylate transporter substrate binding protein n=1 Tax=Ramlibacter agri TaxID=2728837 RepID=A0A848H5N0_9BURK|nr:tripartite tricarboxylate transporter substrate-binding protein [Ramlibacter agri]NML43018.1 tripartite tricarboxylate transporter substrate binding protein [Ramlibacter agri]